MTISIDDERRQRALATNDGTTTQDLNRRAPAPAQVGAPEQRLRTCGLWMIASGSVTVALTLVIAVVWYVGFGTNMPSAFLMPFYGVGFGAVTLGCIEHLGRTSRAAQQDALKRLARLEDGVAALADLLPEEMHQRWYAGFGAGAREVRHTGTDMRATGRADVLKMRQRREQR